MDFYVSFGGLPWGTSLCSSHGGCLLKQGSQAGGSAKRENNRVFPCRVLPELSFPDSLLSAVGQSPFCHGLPEVLGAPEWKPLTQHGRSEASLPGHLGALG